MAVPQDGGGRVAVEPEVAPITTLLLHPLSQDPKFLGAAFVVFLSVVLFSGDFLYKLLRPQSKRRTRGKRSGIPTVLLVGPADGGKTALFAKLAHGTRAPTHTSITPSSTTFTLDPQSPAIRLVDLPGHPRLKDEVKRNLAEADGVIFVVGVQSLLMSPGSIAEDLVPILTSLCSAAQSSGSPGKLLLLASKLDTLTRPNQSGPSPTIAPANRQTGISRLESVLTRELDRLKQSRASSGGRIEGIGAVQSASGTGLAALWKRLFGGGVVLPDEGDEGEDEGLVWGGKGQFKWEDVDGVEFSWGVSALGPVGAKGEDGEGLKDVEEWLRGI